MNTYIEFIVYELKLAFRYRSALLTNYLFPICLFITFGEVFRPPPTNAATQANLQTLYTSGYLNMALLLSALGNGLWGTGMRSVNERENNRLRRLKVTPVSPLPLLTGLMVAGWVMFMLMGFGLAVAAHFRYGMRVPKQWPALILFVSLGSFAFRSLGLIVASVANSTQEANVLTNVLFLPMLFLSGATIPLGLLPQSIRAAATFAPSYHMMQLCQSIFQPWAGGQAQWQSVAALAGVTALCMFIALQLFRWDKDQKVRPVAKLLVVTALAPVLLLGVHQIRHGQYAPVEWYLNQSRSSEKGISGQTAPAIGEQAPSGQLRSEPR